MQEVLPHTLHGEQREKIPHPRAATERGQRILVDIADRRYRYRSVARYVAHDLFITSLRALTAVHRTPSPARCLQGDRPASRHRTHPGPAAQDGTAHRQHS